VTAPIIRKGKEFAGHAGSAGPPLKAADNINTVGGHSDLLIDRGCSSSKCSGSTSPRRVSLVTSF